MTPEEVASIAPEPPATPTPGGATADVVAARAERDALLAAPWVPARILRTSEQRLEDAYRAQYGGDPFAPAESLAADPEIATLPADALRGRITAIRRMLAAAVDGSGDYQVLLADLHEAYAQLYPEGQDDAEAAPAPRPTLEDGPPLPTGMSWDAAAWSNLHAAAPDAAARVALGGVQNAIASALREPQTFTDDDADKALAEHVGEWRVAQTKTLAEAVLAHPAAAPYRERLTSTGLHLHPKVRMALAEVGARLKGAPR